MKDREAQEKMVRAREAREKQDRERAERAAKKKALVDFNAPDDQEGVMDSLLEALKTGSAFNRDQKRKRAPRAAGGNSSFLGKFFWAFNISFTILGSLARCDSRSRTMKALTVDEANLIKMLNIRPHF